TGFLGSLRELDISLWELDDKAGEAIEMHNLEVLKITTAQSTTGHGPVLAKILQSCRRLKDVEYRIDCRFFDINAMVEGLIEERNVGNDGIQQQSPPEASWGSPDLESLQMYSCSSQIPRQGKEQWFFVEDDTEGNNGSNYGSNIWVALPLMLIAELDDRTALHLYAPGHGLPKRCMEDIGRDGLTMRFLRHISPSRKLKKLRLDDVKFVRPCTCFACSD
ncbi:hypothetical protein BGX31_001888, partial [Mortierella sp. GBA43]